MIEYTYRHNLSKDEILVVEKNGNIYHPQNIIKFRKGNAYYFLKKINIKKGFNSFKVVAYLINAKTGKNEYELALHNTDKFSERFEFVDFNKINSEEVRRRIAIQVNGNNRSKPLGGFFKETRHCNRQGNEYFKIKSINNDFDGIYSQIDDYVNTLFIDGKNGLKEIKKSMFSDMCKADVDNNLMKYISLDTSENNITFKYAGSWVDPNPNALMVIKKNKNSPNKRVIVKEDNLIILT